MVKEYQSAYIHTGTDMQGATMTPFVPRAVEHKKSGLERAFMDALKYSLSENGRLLGRYMYVCMAFVIASLFLS